MSPAVKQQALIDDLNIIDDLHERLNAIVSRAASKRLDEKDKTDANLVPGCVSRVWLYGGLLNGRMHLSCDAESPMVKGLAALLCEIYTDADPAEVLTIEPRIWEDCGFVKMLSPTRLNGLANMRHQIRLMAEEFRKERDR